MFMFGSLLLANIGTLVTELSAVKVTSTLLDLPGIPSVILVVLVSFIFISRGNYKLTEKIMLISSLFFLCYIISAVMAKPDWGLATSNLLYPHGAVWTPSYSRDFLLIGMGVLGTTITPWGQYFISSFAYDKKIEKGKVSYSQLETYWGAFLTDFFSFFMIVATAATLYVNKIDLVSGEQAAMAIAPFAGKLAGTLFAVGLLNAGFMGLVVVSLSTAYAFAEFFGLSGSLNDTFKESKTFYILFIVQLVIALGISILPNIKLFQLAVFTQTINAISLPVVFYFLIKLTSDKELMGEFANNKFQFYFSIACTIIILIASFFTMGAAFLVK
jgi:Mn2+/Fe2+ NRAMP family transporter